MWRPTASDVRFFNSAAEMSDKERRGRHVHGWAGECAASGADRQVADGLGGKPGIGLPFLDGSPPDALW